MLFNSLSFAIFLPLVFGLYWLIGGCGHAGRVTLPRHPFHLRYPFHLQNLFIVAASYVFYGWWDWKFLLLITFTSLWAWASGMILGRIQSGSGLQTASNKDGSHLIPEAVRRPFPLSSDTPQGYRGGKMGCCPRARR